ncbi:MAG TPA: DUF2442 domain-containing protein [Ignavibacteria bacterium]|nr:DUF2442 domain-containing protein [Ignavibacteria bacterium]
MNTLIIKKSEPLATDISFDEYNLIVEINDGRIVSVPLEWFPRLLNANKKQRNNWRFIGNGIGIHWEDIDEDISVESLMN